MSPSEGGYRGESRSTQSPANSRWFSFASSTTPLVWWLRVVGVFYLFLFVMIVFVRLPLQTFAPEGTLALAASGDPIARYLVDTWVMFGLEVGVIGVALLVASRNVAQARLLVWTVMGIELVRGIVDDIYMIARGYEPGGFIAWIMIHSIIIVTGYLALKTARQETTNP